MKTVSPMYWVAALIGFALCASSLTGVHGVESAWILGMVLPFLVALSSAAEVRAIRVRGTAVTAPELLGKVFKKALLILAIPVLILAFNQFRVRQCDPLQGLAFILLGPGIGCVLAAGWGALCGAIFSHRITSTVASLAGPATALAVVVAEVWSTPAIFIYSVFAGYFPGTIYDENVSIPQAYFTYRWISVGWATAIAFALIAGWRAGVARLQIERVLEQPAASAICLIAFVASVVATCTGAQWGHRSSTSHIVEELGAQYEKGPCVVYAPREMLPADRQRLAADCDFFIADAASQLGVEVTDPIYAYFYRNAEEKQQLMGAGRTYIAKPWRREVHLQQAAWPHRVLSHELVHAVAGEANDGPLRVAGTWGGWLPNSGVIEGLAVALSWTPPREMTPHQWSRALLELEELPELTPLMSVSFSALPARKAYTAAGSFIGFLLESQGKEYVRELYRVGFIANSELAELETAWHAFLRQIELPAGSLERARAYFDRPSIFSATCPHRLAALRHELDADLNAGDHDRAVASCRSILEIDPHDHRTQAHLVGALARDGDRAAATALLEEIVANDDIPEPRKIEARIALADAHWLLGQDATALGEYEELASAPHDPNTRRTLQVKTLALHTGGAEAALTRELLVGKHGRGSSSAMAMYLAGELHSSRTDGLGEYLLARQLFNQRYFDQAQRRFALAAALGLPSDAITDENTRLYGQALFAAGKLQEAHELFQEHAGGTGLLAIQSRAWLRRINYALANP